MTERNSELRNDKVFTEEILQKECAGTPCLQEVEHLF